MLVLDYIYKNRLFLEYIKRRGFIMRIILAARSINEFVIGKIERGEGCDGGVWELRHGGVGIPQDTPTRMFHPLLRMHRLPIMQL